MVDTVKSQRMNIDSRHLDEMLFAVAEGNMSSLGQLYERTHTGIYAYALSLLRDPHDAEDVVQDVYMSVYNSAYQYSSKGKPLAWMMTITRNLAMAKLREKNRFEDEAISENIAIDVSRLSAAERITLQDCMNKLDSNERQIVVLHAVSGFRHREIAQIMKMSLPAVLSRYSRALRKLRTYYGKGAGHEE